MTKLDLSTITKFINFIDYFFIGDLIPKPMKILATLIIVLLLTISTVDSQNLNVQGFRIDGQGMVTVTALIEANHSARERYAMSVYSSVDNYTQPINYTLADMEPGKPYNIKFDGPKLVGTYSGDIMFKFRIEATTYPIELTTNGNMKPGKKMDLTWTDHEGSSSYNIELYQRSNLVEQLARDHSGLSYTGVLPKTVEKGKDYSVRVVPTDDPKSSSEFIPVAVVGGIGWYWFVIPVAGGGVAAVVLLGGGEDPTGETGFEDPPGPPSFN
jgi:hypothetical protein